jgi:hypothetical protein
MGCTGRNWHAYSGEPRILSMSARCNSRIQLPDGCNLQAYCVADMEEKIAGILQPPGNIRNYYVNTRAETASFDLRRNCEGNRVVGPVQPENTEHLERRHSLGRNVAGNVSGRECRLRILITLQDVFMHFAVTRFVAALAAGDVHDDKAACLSGRGIEAHIPTPKLKSSMHRMEGRVQGKGNLAACRIQAQAHLLRASRCSNRNTQKQQGGCNHAEAGVLTAAGQHRRIVAQLATAASISSAPDS